MKVLITAGPTREPIDPVRFLTNRSSGKMGYALAGAFAHEGHSVLLISGPTHLDVPAGVDFIPVETAAEMLAAVSRYIGKMDAAVFAAAVADYTPATVEPQKIKKSGETLTLEFVRTVDILGSARKSMGFTGTLVGFAAETENLESTPATSSSASSATSSSPTTFPKPASVSTRTTTKSCSFIPTAPNRFPSLRNTNSPSSSSRRSPTFTSRSPHLKTEH